MDRAGVAGVLFWTAAAMTAGYVSLGFVTERLARSGVPPAGSDKKLSFLPTRMVLMLNLPLQFSTRRLTSA